MEEIKKIYYSIKENNLKELDKILKGKKEIFAIRPYLQSLLLHASFENNIQIVEYLIKKGFDVNEKDYNGYAPIHACAENNYADLAELLLKNGANPDLKDNFGNTSLMKAILHWDKNLDVIKVLIDNNSNLDEKNNFGDSPRSLANKMTANLIIDLFNHKKE
jgi:ankyrin repeat protein